MKTVILHLAACLLFDSPDPNTPAIQDTHSPTINHRARLNSEPLTEWPPIHTDNTGKPVFGIIENSFFSALDITSVLANDFKKDVFDLLYKYQQVAITFKPLLVGADPIVRSSQNQDPHQLPFSYRDETRQKIVYFLLEPIKNTHAHNRQEETDLLHSYPRGILINPTTQKPMFRMQQPGMAIFCPQNNSAQNRVLITMKNPHPETESQTIPKFSGHTERQLLTSLGIVTPEEKKSLCFEKNGGTRKIDRVDKTKGLSPQTSGTLFLWTKDCFCLRPEANNRYHSCLMRYLTLARAYPNIRFDISCHSVTYFLEELENSVRSVLYPQLPKDKKTSGWDGLTPQALSNWIERLHKPQEDMDHGLRYEKEYLHTLEKLLMMAQKDDYPPFAKPPAHQLLEEIVWAREIQRSTILEHWYHTLKDLARKKLEVRGLDDEKTLSNFKAAIHAQLEPIENPTSMTSPIMLDEERILFLADAVTKALSLAELEDPLEALIATFAPQFQRALSAFFLFKISKAPDDADSLRQEMVFPKSRDPLCVWAHGKNPDDLASAYFPPADLGTGDLGSARLSSAHLGTAMQEESKSWPKSPKAHNKLGEPQSELESWPNNLRLNVLITPKTTSPAEHLSTSLSPFKSPVLKPSLTGSPANDTPVDDNPANDTPVASGTDEAAEVGLPNKTEPTEGKIQLL
jgi:hypothetical protein